MEINSSHNNSSIFLSLKDWKVFQTKLIILNEKLPSLPPPNSYMYTCLIKLIWLWCENRVAFTNPLNLPSQFEYKFVPIKMRITRTTHIRLRIESVKGGSLYPFVNVAKTFTLTLPNAKCHRKAGWLIKIDLFESMTVFRLEILIAIRDSLLLEWLVRREILRFWF